MTLERRLNAFRPDLADERLVGQVQAARFVAGKPAEIVVNKSAMRIQPDDASALDTELLWGEEVMVFDRRDGWAWAQCKLDGYVGYIKEDALGELHADKTHWVIAPRTFLYPGPDMKIPPLDTLSMGSRLTVTGEAETRGTRYLLTDRGAVIASHLAEIGVSQFNDYVSIAGRLIETPYLWGGRSSFGIDCSGIVQVALMMVGKHVLRDADMQEASIGTEIERSDLQRGDLVFWKGHVAIMEDKNMMIHANGYSMTVARERLAGAINRIAPIYGQPRLYRRP
ncbi:C40 family peptidase [Rhizobium sp. KVB221]|uniref:C40 family peptidase n=1 Tax=Rhizobium setariae TaxID=2801340 RepID=A0A936YTG8_9HYPH|nr:NlpC/P60 family protein [Rhizobium setariae]MBL0372706.1 C40 family peptidase [Rhizobium setariae]